MNTGLQPLLLIALIEYFSLPPLTYRILLPATSHLENNSPCHLTLIEIFSLPPHTYRILLPSTLTLIELFYLPPPTYEILLLAPSNL